MTALDARDHLQLEIDGTEVVPPALLAPQVAVTITASLTPLGSPC